MGVSADALEDVVEDVSGTAGAIEVGATEVATVTGAAASNDVEATVEAVIGLRGSGGGLEAVLFLCVFACGRLTDFTRLSPWERFERAL